MLLLDGSFALSDDGRASLAQVNLDSFPGGGSILEKNRFEGVSDYLYEGDINLTEEQLAALESKLNNGTTRQKRQASKVAALWANKKVFYYFDATLGDPMKALVKKTLAYLAARTCLTFVENATATNRIRVFPGSGCYSNIGMIGGEQDLSLADGCDTAENQHNYNKLTAEESVNYTPYEYGSVMHYDAQSLTVYLQYKNAKLLIPLATYCDGSEHSSGGGQNILIVLNMVYGKALRGVDLEQRHERLRNLRLVDVVSSQPGPSTDTDENQLIGANLASTPGGGPILEQNRIEGVIDYLYEGDINLTEEQLTALELKLSNSTTRQKRQASKVAALWANKKVFYYFDASIGEPLKALVKKTLTYFTARTCLTFVENATATNRIRVFNGSGCYSSIGMIGGEQDLSLGDGCGIMGTIAREFMHALGIHHMQSRYDRDTYITVDLTNVPPAGCGAVLTAAPDWKVRKVVLGNATNPDLRDTYAMCNDWIKVG
nr:Peptidase M12A domain containing protein [Haemonchus contortus]